MTLVIRLDGSNFVSEKTKATFENALQDGHQVQSMSAPEPPAPRAAEPRRPSPQALAPAPAATRPPLDYQRVLKSLEQGLTQSFEHQSLTMHVHERYLDNQSEYSNIFFQLMQQQIALSSNGNNTPQQAQTTAVVLQSLERSMMRFHDHQVETLGVHERHLRNQAEFSASSVQLLRRQYATLINGDSPQYATFEYVESPAPAIAPRVPPAPPVARPQVSAPALAPVAAPVVAATVVAPAPPVSVSGTVMALDIKALSNELLAIVSEKTGYPAEMLDMDMDMEADLGIDSIKRVEILGVMQELYPNLPQVRPEELAELRTLGQIIEHMGASMPVGAAPVAPTNGAGSRRAVAAPGTLDVGALSHKLLEVVSEKTGYPAEMLDMDMDMEADLGIDSIKRVEILGVMQELYPNLPQVRPEELAELRTLGQIIEHMGASAQVTAPALPTNGSSSPRAVAGAGLDVAALSHKLLEVVSEKTGYPAEMLDVDMDMEADLGIDSIKRVEILGVMQELYPDLPQVRPEELAELRTLGQIIEHLGQQAATPVKKKPESLEPALEHNIKRSLVRLEPLPAPDILEFSLPANHICLIGDDGSPTSVQLAQALSELGWKVVLLSSPLASATQRPGANGIEQVLLQDMSEEHLQQQLAALGPVGAFIHLNPSLTDAEGAKAVVKHVFFVAKHLQQSLNAAASLGRSCFITVVRLDGEFGLGGAAEFDAISGGLFGLTKTLNLEWPQVFCRALDLAPDLDPGQAAQRILAELHDPNRLIVEVGYGSQGRVTLTSKRTPN